MLEALERIAKGATADSQEDEWLDFKEDVGEFKPTVEILSQTAACLANAGGGWIVLGVADKVSGPSALRGTALAPRRVQRAIYDRTRPPLNVGCEELEFRQTRLLVVQVLRSSVVHADTKGVVRRRFQDRCDPLDAALVASLQYSKSEHDWSAEPSERSGEDIRSDALESLRRRTSVKHPKLAALPRRRFLAKLGLTSANGTLTNAGERMLCDRGPPASPGAIYQYKRSPRSEPSVIEHLTDPVPLLLDRLLEFVRVRRSTTPVNLPDGTQIALPDFPEEAVREALSNALLHQEFRIGEPVTVEHSPTNLTITSPGSFIDGVSENNILNVQSNPRNRRLFDAATLAAMSERAGQGVDRMFRELIRGGHDKPSITQSARFVRVSLPSGPPRTNFVRLVAQLPEAIETDVDVLIALSAFLTKRTLDARELAELIQQSISEAATTLRTLADDAVALLEPTLATAKRVSPKYRLRAATLASLGREVVYHRQDPVDLDTKVRRHLADYDVINNRTLQSLFDVDVSRARRMLDDLRRRGLIEKLPGSERGRSVRYGPGPNLDGRKRT